MSRLENARMHDMGRVGIEQASAGLEKEGEGEVVGSNAGCEHAFEEGEGFARGVRFARVGSDHGVVGEEVWVWDGLEDGIGVGEMASMIEKCGEEEENASEEGSGRGSDDVGVDLLEVFEGFALID